MRVSGTSLSNNICYHAFEDIAVRIGLGARPRSSLLRLDLDGFKNGTISLKGVRCHIQGVQMRRTNLEALVVCLTSPLAFGICEGRIGTLASWSVDCGGFSESWKG